MKFLISIICCTLLVTQWLPAEKNEKNYTLNELINLAKSTNLLLKITDLDKDIAREEYRDLRALPNPELEYSQGKGDVEGESHKPSLRSIGLKWSVPNPLHRHYFLASMKKNVKSAEIEADMKKREIIKGLKTHYFRLQFYKKVKTFMEEKLRILDEVNKITKAKVSIGESKEIDYLRSSVEIQKNKTNLFKVDKTIAYERTKLNEYLNYSLPGDFNITDDFGFTPLPGIEEEISRLIDKSPLIGLKANQVAQEKAHLKAAWSSIIEHIEIFGEKEKEMEGDIWRVGIGVSIPIFNFKSAHIRKAKLQREKAKTEFQHAKKHFFADIQQMISEIRILEKEIETFKGAILKEGRENMVLSEKLYKAGEVPLMVFLDSQNSFFEVQERYYEAITEWNILKANLEELLGEEL
jgi:outer membrane protein TolC